MHVADARLDEEVNIHAVAGNLIAHHGESERRLRALAQHGDVHSGALGAFQQFSHVGSGHVVGGLAIHRDDDVAGTNAGAVSRAADKGCDDDDFVIARTHFHAHTVIFATLLFSQRGVGLGIEEIGVRIEHPQHAGNGAVVDRLAGIHRLGVILLHQLVDLREIAQAVVEVADPGRRGVVANALAEDHAKESEN